jgi:hypothetical protein
MTPSCSDSTHLTSATTEGRPEAQAEWTAAGQLASELAQAAEAIAAATRAGPGVQAERVTAGSTGAALDHYVRGLGLALQLGPAPAEQATRAILQGADSLARYQAVTALSALGPAMVDLVGQVRDAGALPSTPVMEAWAIVAGDIGALIGQVGLALSIEPSHRTGILANARAHAILLDDATGGLFDLRGWLDRLQIDQGLLQG